MKKLSQGGMQDKVNPNITQVNPVNQNKILAYQLKHIAFLHSCKVLKIIPAKK